MERIYGHISCSMLGFRFDIWGSQFDSLPGIHKWLLNFCCCSKCRHQLLWFWICLFGEERFLNCIKLSINTRKFENWNDKSETPKLSQSCRLNPTGVSCRVTGIPLRCRAGFSCLLSLLSFLACLVLSSFFDRFLQIEQFLCFLPLISKDQVWVKTCFRLFVFPTSIPSNSLPPSPSASQVLFFSSGISLDWSWKKRLPVSGSNPSLTVNWNQPRLY